MLEPSSADNDMVVDAHQHFWDPVKTDYPWMTQELAPIRRPFTPDDLRPLLHDTGVDQTVLIQTRSSMSETAEFLDLAAATDFIAGVVGWVDLTAPDVRAVLHELQSGNKGKYLVGIRHQVHDEADPEWLLRHDVLNGLTEVAEADLAYDLLVRTRELPAALQVVQRFPQTRFVIDHLAKPAIRKRELSTWAEAMAPFSNLPNVYCKISGMVSEADWTNWAPSDLIQYVNLAIDWFGEDRLMFGSDWPVCLMAASYRQVYEACLFTLADIKPDGRRKIMGENAVRFYRLNPEQ